MGILNVREIEYVQCMIQAMILYLNYRGYSDIDVARVDYFASATRAIENMCLVDAEPIEPSLTIESMMLMNLRFVSTAVYIDRAPVFDFSEMENLQRTLRSDKVKNTGSYVDHDEVATVRLVKKQVIHSDLMITRMDQLVVGKKYWEFRNEVPNMVVTIEEIDKVSGWIHFSDLLGRKGSFKAVDRGIVPNQDGKWNPNNWLELVFEG